MKASMPKDGRFVWMVCDPHTCTYLLVCSIELATGKFKELIDGCSVVGQADGTLFIEGEKTYLSDENGEPLGAVIDVPHMGGAAAISKRPPRHAEKSTTATETTT